MQRDPVTGMYKRETVDTYNNVYRRLPVYFNGERSINVTNPRTKTVRSTILWDGQGTKRFHSCIHTRESSGAIYGETHVHAKYKNPRSDRQDGYSIGNLYDIPAIGERYNGGWYSPPSIPSIAAPPPLSLDWGKARESLLQELEGRNPVDNSVAQNIVEFRQLTRLATSLSAPLKDFIAWCKHGPYRKVKIRVRRTEDLGPWRQSYSYNLRGYYDERVSLESLRWGMRDIAGTHLAATFGLKPLIGDVTNWVTEYWRLRIHNDWWRLRATGKPSNFYARTPMDTQETVLREQVLKSRGSTGSYFAGVPMLIRFSGKRTGWGTLGVRASLHPKSDSHMVSATIATALGLNAPLKTVWDLIPFSFVADWVLPVGKALERVDTRAFGKVSSLADRYEIHDRWYSITENLELGLHRPEAVFDCAGFGPSSPYKDYVIKFTEGFCGSSTRTYTRQRGWPGIDFLPRMDPRWSTWHTFTSAALIVQSLLRGRK